MSVKRDKIIVGLLTVAFVVAAFAFFFTALPFSFLFSCLTAIVLGFSALGKTPVAFVLGVLATLIMIVMKDGAVSQMEDTWAPIFLIGVLWVSFLFMQIRRQSMERSKWQWILNKDEEIKEAKDLRREIVLYEQRQRDLEKRTSQRRLLSNAARELGALLDPQQIQSKLMEIARLIFPGQQVEMSYGQHRDGFDGYVIQKRQPLLVPSEGFKGIPLMAVPVSSQRAVVGVLRVGGEGLQEPKNLFSRDDLRLLDVLGGLASLAMDNSQLFHQIQQSALRDNLTGLLTQRAFQEKLDAALLEASRYTQPLSLIMADIDHFKSINDTYGHQAGDQVLQGFAHILDRNARDIDILCRHGGEEFALLLLQSSHSQALATAEKIRVDLAEQGFETAKGILSVTGSFGVATFPEDATSAQQLFRQADQRLYKAKHGGRNQTQGRGT